MTRDSDLVSLPALLVGMRRCVPHGTPQVSETEQRDHFGAMVSRIRCARNTMEHRVLARLLRSVVEEPTTESIFRVTEIAALSPAVLSRFSVFIDDYDYLNERYDQAMIGSVLVMNGISTTTGTKTTLG